MGNDLATSSQHASGSQNVRKKSFSQAVKSLPGVAITRVRRRRSKTRLNRTTENISSMATVVASEEWLHAQRKEHNNSQTRLLQTKFEQVFTNLSEKVRKDVGSRREQRKTVNKTVFLTTCQHLFGEHIDTYMFEKLFDFMDSDRNGVVDEVEFSITVCFLLRQRHDENNTELAYNIFDSNRSGGLTMLEFSEMLAAVIGTTLKTVERIEPIRVEFEKFVDDRAMIDSLLFYRKLCGLFDFNKNEIGFHVLPLAEVNNIISEFIIENAPHDINVSHEARNTLLHAIEDARDQGLTSLSSKYFLSCFQQIKYLLESNSLLDFKDSLRKPPYSNITKGVWKRFNLKNDVQLNFQQFSIWTSDHPGIFAFITDMQDDMANLLSKLENSVDLDL